MTVERHEPAIDPLSWPIGLMTFFVLTRLAASALKFGLPDLEPNYINTAQALFGPRVGDAAYAAYYPLAYPLLLYGVNLGLRSWVLSSHALYVIFSTVIGVSIYALVRSVYDRQVARHALVMSALMPNYTAAVVGYSHTPVVACGFLVVAVYAFWRLSNDEAERTPWVAIATLASGGAILVRPESLFSCLFLVAAWFWIRRSHRWMWRAATAAAMAGTVLAMLIGVALGAMTLSATEPIGLFGSARYAYSTYITTFSMRALKGEADPDLSTKLSDRAFGPAKDNGYSVFRAIRRNPPEAAKNVGFNVRSLLAAAGHPLFLPLFLYPLVGVGLVSQSALRRRAGWLFIGSVVPGTVASLLFLHVEVRYMVPLVLPPLVLIAAALDRFDRDGRRYVAWATYMLTGLVSLTYLIYFRVAPVP
jgi:uncharacterized membrane protein YozB (DUF420 family)